MGAPRAMPHGASAAAATPEDAAGRVLVLDAAGAGCLAALVRDGRAVVQRRLDEARGQAAALPALAAAVLAEAGVRPAALDLIGATVGPGGFTGLRAALSFAHGLALASGVPLVGVTIGEALAEELHVPPGRALWVAQSSRRGHVYLERDGAVTSYALDALPAAPEPVALAGEAAAETAAVLLSRGADASALDARRPGAAGLARAALRRHRAEARGELPPRPAQPLYAEPPQARPAGPALRPAPS